MKYVERKMGGDVTSMTLIKRESSSACVIGVSFGFKGNVVWVDKGCSGSFKVVYNFPGMKYSIQFYSIPVL